VKEEKEHHYRLQPLLFAGGPGVRNGAMNLSRLKRISTHDKYRILDGVNEII
jgi:hypothetical protein